MGPALQKTEVGRGSRSLEDSGGLWVPLSRRQRWAVGPSSFSLSLPPSPSPSLSPSPSPSLSLPLLPSPSLSHPRLSSFVLSYAIPVRATLFHPPVSYCCHHLLPSLPNRIPLLAPFPFPPPFPSPSSLLVLFRAPSAAPCLLGRPRRRLLQKTSGKLRSTRRRLLRPLRPSTKAPDRPLHRQRHRQRRRQRPAQLAEAKPSAFPLRKGFFDMTDCIHQALFSKKKECGTVGL